MAIKGFQKASGETRGDLYFWSTPAGGSFSWHWPSQFAGVSEELHSVATSLGNGLSAAAASLAAADGQFKRVEDVARVGAEASSRYLGPGFRAVRQVAISERTAVASVRYSLKRPIEATGTPNSTMVDYLYRQDVRRQLEAVPGGLGEKFAWLMASEGTDVFNAVAPYLELTAFSTDPVLSEQVLNEWYIRKAQKFLGNEPSDNFSTAAAPLTVKMDEASLRNLAVGKAKQIDLREQAVDAANKLLLATINFTSQSANLTETESLNLLFGKTA